MISEIGWSTSIFELGEMPLESVSEPHLLSFELSASTPELEHRGQHPFEIYRSKLVDLSTSKAWGSLHVLCIRYMC